MLLEDLAIRCLKRLIQNDQLASSFDLKRAVKVSYGNGPMSKSAIDKLSAFKNILYQKIVHSGFSGS